MKSPLTAVFIGKFQPPHIGHILTAKKLLSEYSSVIIGITDGLPNFIPVEKVISLFSDVLGDTNVSFKHIRGAVDEGTAVFDFDFDVICSGNPEVLTLLKDQGIETRFIERSSDEYFTGSSIRKNYLDNSISTSNQDIYEFQLVDTKWLKPIEKVFQSHLSTLEESINSQNTINTPLIVDSLTGAVLDGSHRYAYLLKYGYKKAPSLLVDYSNESIFVGNELSHRFKHNKNKVLHKDNIRARALKGDLLEPRTTRHFFPFRKDEHPVSLDSLIQGTPNDIENLMSSYSIIEQVNANKNYVKEIDEEILIVEEYLQEQKILKEYLNEHIVKMNKS